MAKRDGPAAGRKPGSVPPGCLTASRAGDILLTPRWTRDGPPGGGPRATRPSGERPIATGGAGRRGAACTCSGGGSARCIRSTRDVGGLVPPHPIRAAVSCLFLRAGSRPPRAASFGWRNGSPAHGSRDFPHPLAGASVACRLQGQHDPGPSRSSRLSRRGPTSGEDPCLPRRCGGVPATPTLRAFPPPLRYEVHPVARLREGGLLEACGPWFPAEGACLLVLWRPGEEAGFEAAWTTLRRRGALWAMEPPGARPGWVVRWVGAPGAAGKGS